jgi:hypothetical protein
MTSHTKNKLTILILSILLPILEINSMQLSNPHKNEIYKIYNKEKNINGTVSLGNVSIKMNEIDYPLVLIAEVITHFPITYETKNNTNIPTKHNEPFVCAIIIDKKTNKQIQFQDGNTINIPAKIFHNADNGSKIFFKTIKGTKYNFSLICTKNQNLNGNNFKEQFNLCTKLFYTHAFVNNQDDIEILEKSNIITSDTSVVMGLVNFCPVLVSETINKHQENGCSSEEKFVQQIINTSPLKSGHNTTTNIHTLLMGREYGNKGLFKDLR